VAIHLQTRIVDLRRNLLAMGAAVEGRVSGVVRALETGDAELARTIRESDAEIDQMQVELEGECMKLLALSHPVASDLRLIVTVLRISGELERIADHAKGIAKRLIKIDRTGPIAMPRSLVDLAEGTRSMIAEAVATMAEPNLDRCLQIRRSDRRIDLLNKEVLTWSREEITRDVGHTAQAIDILSAAQRFERMSDIATNIAEDLIFLVEGRIVRHGAE
jgi:phosphate transport system protein